jgi:hypothetical protein
MGLLTAMLVLASACATPPPAAEPAAAVASTAAPASTTTTAIPAITVPPTPKVDLAGWRPVKLGVVSRRAQVSLAAGVSGIVLSTNPDEEGPVLWRSVDGVEWSEPIRLPVEHFSYLAPLVGIGEQGIVAVALGDPEAAADGRQQQLSVWFSADGRTWEQVDADPFSRAGFLYQVAATPQGFFAAGEIRPDPHRGLPMIWRSVDGRTWERVLDERGPEGEIRAVAWNGAELVAAGREGGFPAAWTSGDGLRWAVSRLPADGHGGSALGAASAGDRWVVVGSPDENSPLGVWISSDGEEWELRAGPDPTGGAPTLGWQQGFSATASLGGTVATAAGLVRRAHENWCYVGSCFEPGTELLLTRDGETWSSVPLPEALAASRFLPLVATPAGGLAAATVADGAVVVWTRDAVDDAVPFEPDPAPPPLPYEKVSWGADLEPGVRYAYSVNVHCGIDQLGEFNGALWVIDPDWEYPEDLALARVQYGTVELVAPDRIVYTAGGQAVGEYVPSDRSGLRGCY